MIQSSQPAEKHTAVFIFFLSLSLFLYCLGSGIESPPGGAVLLCYIAKVCLCWVKLNGYQYGHRGSAAQHCCPATPGCCFVCVFGKTLAVITGLTNRRLVDMHFYQISHNPLGRGSSEKKWNVAGDRIE